MRAITVYGPNDARMEEVPRPTIGPRDTLVRVACFGICGTDISILSGDSNLIRQGLIKYPVRIGHEWSGIVEEVGSQVTRFKSGDRVVSETAVSCGECEACQKGDFGKCREVKSLGTVNHWPGCFADYMLMPERHLYKLPDGIPLDVGALIEPSCVALAGMRRIDFSAKPTLLVVGTGAIGLAAVALCRHFGASKVLLSGRKASKLAVGLEMGADAVVNATTDDVGAFVADQTLSRGVDAIIETSGNVSVFEGMAGLAAPKAVVSLVGFYERPIAALDIDSFVFKEIMLQGIMGEWFLVSKMIEILASGKVDLKPIITHRFGFDDAIGAMKTAGERAGTKIKMLVEMSGGRP
jgi:L-iditol 2-dehydrogenase